MEYKVWLPDGSFVICTSRAAVEVTVAGAGQPCRVEVYAKALVRVDTYGLEGGPALPVMPTSKPTLSSVSVLHIGP